MEVVQLRMNVARHARTVASAVVLVGVLGAKYEACVRGELDCRHAVRDANDGLAVLVCEREYARTSDPWIGAKLANSLRRSGDLPGAAAIANGLLATPARADALQVLGKIAVSQNRLDAGRAELENARALHLAEARPDQVAVDDQALAGIFTRQKQFAEALRALDACIVEARVAQDGIVEGYCHMSAGSVLGDVGSFEGAHAEYELARPLLTMDRDLAALALERGSLNQRYSFGPRHQSYEALAVAELKVAVEHARRAALPRVERAAELNLVYSLAELGHTEEAAQHLERARILDIDDSNADARALLQARIAYRQGNSALATSINSATYDRLTDDDDRLNVCVMQARIAMAANDLELAATWASRGVEVAETMRAAQSAIELRPWMLSARRQPYEILFTALARAHRLDEALAAFEHWQGRTLLDSMARGRSGTADLRAAAVYTETLRRVVPMLSHAPFMETIERTTLLARLRGVELIAVLVAENEVWRIVARNGALDMVDLGPFAALQPALLKFRGAPTNVDTADQLGTRLLGDAAFRDTSETLFVLLDAQVSGVPIAALRAGGRPLIAMRPIVHAPRLSELGCVRAPSEPRHAVVIGDARGDLPAATREAYEVAAALGVKKPAIGAAATRDALFATSKDDLLHIAVHANIDLGTGSLAMYDQPVSALEISEHGGAPALVVLSDCASAVADDGELAASLATAFLAAGSAQVIATLRAVTDAGAHEVTSAFYREGGAADPARVLARIQASLALTANTDWPNFVMFGHDTCR
jgi:tetratricopeptide (TPR) repeat protein